MILTLRMTGGNGPGEERTLEQGTLTLGRGAENDWVLTDAERTLSKLHCRIDQSDEGFLITDLSTNGVFVGGDPQPIGRGRSRTLNDGDVVILGPFHLAATIRPGVARPDVTEPFAAPPPREAGPLPFSGVQHTAGSPIAPQSHEPWLEQIPGGEFGPSRHVRPQGWETPIDPADYAASGLKAVEHPLDPGTMAFSQESEHVSAISTVMKVPTAQSVLPTDWNDVDPMADAELAPDPLAALARAAQHAPVEARADGIADPSMIVIPNEDLLAAPAPVGVPVFPAAEGHDAAGGALPLMIVELPAMPPQAIEPDEASSPAPPVRMAEPVALAPSPPPAPQSVFVPNPVAAAPFVPLPAQAAVAPPPPVAAAPVIAPLMAPVAVPPPGPRNDAGGGMLTAFLEGAGLAPDALAGMTPEDAGRDLGRLVRAAVEGVREILATRAMVKAELRVDQTVIQAADNNAMKFAPDIQRCLSAMVGQPPTGFLPGSGAMEQSLDDIKRHELALVAALNGVFGAITEKLDPEAITTKVKGESGLGNMLPYAREARCWSVYLENFHALQGGGEAVNTGGSLLAPLAAAYARQLRRNE